MQRIEFKIYKGVYWWIIGLPDNKVYPNYAAIGTRTADALLQYSQFIKKSRGVETRVIEMPEGLPGCCFTDGPELSTYFTINKDYIGVGEFCETPPISFEDLFNT